MPLNARPCRGRLLPCRAFGRDRREAGRRGCSPFKSSARSSLPVLICLPLLCRRQIVLILKAGSLCNLAAPCAELDSQTKTLAEFRRRKLLRMIIEDTKLRENGKANKLDLQDRAFHDWYRFVLSFPPHLVRKYLEGFGLSNRSVILDPFCGTGTTLIEAKLSGIQSFGIEANSFSEFASSVKLDWEIDPSSLWNESQDIAHKTLQKLRQEGINDEDIFSGDITTLPLRRLSDDENKLLLTNSISPLPLHKTSDAARIHKVESSK